MLYSEMVRKLVNKEVSKEMAKKYCDILDAELEYGLTEAERDGFMGELTFEEVAETSDSGSEWVDDLKIRADDADDLAYAKETFIYDEEEDEVMDCVDAFKAFEEGACFSDEFYDDEY